MALSDAELVRRSSEMAAEMLARSAATLLPDGRQGRLALAVNHQRQARLRRLLAEPDGASLVFRLADRVLRPVDARTSAAQLSKVTSGPLPGVSMVDAALLRAASMAAHVAPRLVTALVGARLRYETRHLILPASGPGLARRLSRMRHGRQRPNLNLLGEAVLGDEEASARARAVAELLARPDVDCVSVKASSISAGLSLVDFDGSVERVCSALLPLYRHALEAGGKLVNLDMEELRDLPVTVAAFMRALSAPGLGALTAGIALQAYLPGSHRAAEEIISFSEHRVSQGGAPVRVRLVKGANLAMERATAELACWPQPVYETKELTDASYKALLERLLEASSRGVIRVGAASHNLFDIAFALTLAADMGAPVEIEMLAGMAEGQAAAVAQRTGGVLVYAPAVQPQDFRNALAYLARRLDENTTPEGFLRHALELEPGNKAWKEQEALFAASVADRHHVRTAPIHTQDRNAPVPTTGSQQPFFNEPPTDLSLPRNRSWAAARLADAGREEQVGPRRIEPTVADVDSALAAARAASDGWEDLGADKRCETVAGAAHVMAQGRGDAITDMARKGGKTFEEADTEISEAIDYARWYGSGQGSMAHLLGELDLPVTSQPLGVVVVAPPWNFPYAIPAGGVLAALAAGNTVILKPAPETPGTARLLADQLHEAGVPDQVLQYLPVADGPVSEYLIRHNSVDGAILTGSHQTAGVFSNWAPSRRLLAETSGKNAMVVTASADIDQAVRDIVASAFGHAGQKCSAASLAIVAAPLYDRSAFLRQLADTVRSLRVGPAWQPSSQVGPIVGPFTPELERALRRLDPGESWLVEPEQIGDRLWRPGVRLGVQPGSWTHATEWFGPVLGVMRANDLDQAIEWQNGVEFGLTAGLSSLDPDEHRYWAQRVHAGNLYINRTTTGAVVGRQPFGGWKKSSYGPTTKAGGPNYLIALRRWQDDPAEAPTVADAEQSYRSWWEQMFSRSLDRSGLRSESNILRYRPYEAGVLLRAGEGATADDVRRACLLSTLTATPLTISTSKAKLAGTSVVGTGPRIRVESDEAFAAGLAGTGVGTGARVRLIGGASMEVYRAAAEAGLSVLDEPICSCGRIELVRWLREQVVTRSLHRYGNIVYHPGEMEA